MYENSSFSNMFFFGGGYYLQLKPNWGLIKGVNWGLIRGLIRGLIEG